MGRFLRRCVLGSYLDGVMMKYGGNYPKTKEEWWGLVDEFWPQLVAILWRFIPMDDYQGDGTGYPGDVSLAVHIENQKGKRDPALVRSLSAAWGLAPDVPEIHSIPGWAVLCDLLSEEYVLDKDH